MKLMDVTSSDDRIIINIDKSKIDSGCFIDFLERIETELLANEINFNDSILSLGNEIKHNWWKENKNSFIKDNEK